MTSKYLDCDAEQRIFTKCQGDVDSYIKDVLLAMYDHQNAQGGVCKYCKQKTVTIALLQTRSADEGMTAHATCTNPKCGRKWTVH